MSETARLQSELSTRRPTLAALSVVFGVAMTAAAAELWVLALVAFVAGVAVGVTRRADFRYSGAASVEDFQSSDFPAAAYAAPFAGVAVSFASTSALVDVPAVPLPLILVGGVAAHAAMVWLSVVRIETQSRRIGRRRRRKVLDNAADHPRATAEQVQAVTAYAPIVRVLCVTGAFDGVCLEREQLARLLELTARQIREPLKDLRSTGVVTDGGITRPNAVTVTPAGILAVQECEQAARRGLVGGGGVRGAGGGLDDRAVEGDQD